MSVKTATLVAFVGIAFSACFEVISIIHTACSFSVFVLSPGLFLWLIRSVLLYGSLLLFLGVLYSKQTSE